ncbi:MAG: cyclic nucleotide-binding domain-containing protein [Verrucomicrobia bacterium]|nr:cyclic nucleotide-binding domain-containing protein [Verrucomicrobiota bacterium]
MNDALQSVIQDHPFFQGMKPAHLDVIASCATEATFRPEQILFHEGEPASLFYLIEKGRIALEAHEPADGTALVQTLGVGDALGWSWLFPPFVWHFQARALEPTTAVVLNGAHLLIAAERDHEFGYELMKRVSQIVINRLQTTRQQLLVNQMQSASDN